MRIVNGLIGCVLLVLAVLHAVLPYSPLFIFAFLYGTGALFAFFSMKRDMSLPVARVLAVGTTAAMFFFFAGFFTMAPEFQEEWYSSASALEALSMLLSAFAMIPVLSCYSCMLKAECREELAHKRRPAFFSVPESVQQD